MSINKNLNTIIKITVNSNIKISCQMVTNNTTKLFLLQPTSASGNEAI